MSVQPKKSRLLAWGLLGLAVLLVGIYPVVQQYLQAASLLTRISDPQAANWLARYEVRPVDVRDASFDFHGHTIPARVYSPRGVGFAPGILVVHGMHEKGIQEPRLVNFAHALAGSGFLVMTPLVQGLAEYRVEGESAEIIGAAAHEFSQELQVGSVGVVGISFAGGLSLVAATDGRYAPNIAWVASVGGYYDLANVLRFFATGEAVRPDGSVEKLSPHEYGPLIVIYDEPQDFFSPHDAPLAHDAIRLLLSGQGKQSERITAQMTPAGQELMQFLYHKERTSLAPRLLAEIQSRQEQLAAASPAGRLQKLHVPIVLLHATDDNIVPPTELLWLEENVPAAYLREALLSPAMAHAEPGKHAGLLDRLRLVNWIAKLLRQAKAGDTGAHWGSAPAGAWLPKLGSAAN